MARWGIAVVSTVLAAIVMAAVALMGGPSPFEHPDPWLDLDPVWRHLYSLALGLAFGGLVVITTPALVARLAAARALHQVLRPVARSMSPGAVLVVALTSALAEEVIFRGLLMPRVGLFAQAVLFGVLHYAPARRREEPLRVRPAHEDERSWRFTWVFWAMLVGLVFGVLFQATGSLVGPMAAHALVNGLNLRYLRRHDPEPPRRALGGLLGQRG